jgi:diguanylate cyclase (GGDEF)-like protein
LLDVDHFKLYNDHYGHPAGDDVLRKVGSFLKEAVRKGDRLYRYGGDELLLVLPETSREGAETLGQRIIRGLVEQAIPHEAPQSRDNEWWNQWSRGGGQRRTLA